MRYVVPIAVLIALSLYLWRGRDEIRRAWRHHHLLDPAVHWSIVALYALAGAVFSFCIFGTVRMGLPISASVMQYVAMSAIVSPGLIHILARKLTTPVFDRHEISQRDRRELHAIWMFFLMPGIGLGILPTLLPTS